MSKRGLTPHNSPPAKRLHTIHPSPQQKSISIVDALSDELILSILSHLSWVDLCVTQLINKNWARLALDNQLWKKHYILTFGKPRLRGTRGPPVRSDGRQVKSLPSRARAEDSAYKDWKWMFRVSSNWRKGLLSQLLLHRFLTMSPLQGGVPSKNSPIHSVWTLLNLQVPSKLSNTICYLPAP